MEKSERQPRAEPQPSPPLPIPATANTTGAPLTVQSGRTRVSLGSTALGPRPYLPPPPAGGVFGDYELIEEIARGGMGVVYRARHQSLDRVVALKMILGGCLASEQQIKRFHGEAAAAARLDHSGIVPIYEVGERDGQHFFSMALVEGGSLQDRVAHGPLPPREAAELLQQTAEAVHYAHENGVVHRDLKPQNVLLDKQGRPKVTDFGLAKRADSAEVLTHSGDLMGTPGYMAPEQAQCKTHDLGVPVDVYALGGILYCLLTGRPPFQTASLAETLRQIVEQEPVSPRLVNGATPLDLETICLKALHKEPRRRYATAQALADDLARHLRGEPIVARPAGNLEKAWRFCRRKPAVAGLIGAAAVLLVAAVTLVVVSSRLSTAHAQAAAREAQLAAARQVADTQKYYALLGQVRQRESQREPGWTWDNLRDLREAAGLNTPAVDALELQNQAAAALSSFDLRPAGVLDESITVSALACSPDSRWIALAQQKHWTSSVVRVVSVPDGRLLHSLSYGSSLLWQALSQRQDGCESLAVSQDSGRLAVGTRSGMIHLWDLSAAEPKPRSWQADSTATDGLAFHPDQERLISISNSGQLKFWSLESPDQPLTTIAVGRASYPISLGQGEALVAGNRILLGPDYAASRKLESPAYRPALHPGGRLLGLPIGTELLFADAATGRDSRRLADPALSKAHETNLAGVSFHPTGAVAASSDSVRLKVWDVAGGRLLASIFLGSKTPGCLAFTPDGHYLVAGADGKTLLYEVHSPRAAAVLAHQPLPITAIDVAADGRGLACLSEANVSTWNLTTGERREHAALAASGPVGEARRPRLLFDRQGKLLAAASQTGAVQLYRTAAEGSLAPLIDELTGVQGGEKKDAVTLSAFSGDGSRLWGVDAASRVRSWSTPDLKPVTTYSNEVARKLFGDATINDLVASRDCVVTASADGRLTLLSAAGELSGTISIGKPLTLVALSKDERWCAAATLAGELRLVSFPDGTPLAQAQAHRDALTDIAISYDGNWLATAGKDRLLRLWRRGQAALIPNLTLSCPAVPRAVRFSPDGKQLAVLLEGEFAVRVWRLAKLREQLAEIVGIPLPATSP